MEILTVKELRKHLAEEHNIDITRQALHNCLKNHLIEGADYRKASSGILFSPLGKNKIVKYYKERYNGLV